VEHAPRDRNNEEHTMTEYLSLKLLIDGMIECYIDADLRQVRNLHKFFNQHAAPDDHANLFRALFPAAEEIPDDDDRSAEEIPTGPENQALELDNEGLPWDARINSDPPRKNDDNTWRRRRGVSDDTRDDVRAHLRDANPYTAAVAVPDEDAIQDGGPAI
jgi:hypothetical protein